MIGGRLVVAKMRRKVWETVSGWSQEPSSRVKTLPVSVQAEPHFLRSFFWRFLWARRAAIVNESRAIVLALTC